MTESGSGDYFALSPAILKWGGKHNSRIVLRQLLNDLSSKYLVDRLIKKQSSISR